MAKEICISSTPHETRLAILEDDQLSEIYYERENEYTLAGSVYKGRVTRVLPGMQSAFVDIGLERDAFLYVTDFLEMEDQEDTDEVERAAAQGDTVRPQNPQPSQPRGGRDQAREPAREQGSRRDGRRDGRGDGRSPIVESEPSTQPQLYVAPTAAPVPANTSESSIAPSASDTTSPLDESEDLGARRWRGRRRRRGGRGRDEAGEETSGEPTSEPSVGSSDEESDATPLHFEAAASSNPAPSFGQPTPASGPEPRSSSSSAHFLLPGESLSKYGTGEPQKPAPSRLVVSELPPDTSDPLPDRTIAKPSTLVEGEIVWDGRGLMPGESIARHRSREPEAKLSPSATVDAEPSGVFGRNEEAASQGHTTPAQEIAALESTPFEFSDEIRASSPEHAGEEFQEEVQPNPESEARVEHIAAEPAGESTRSGHDSAHESAIESGPESGIESSREAAHDADRGIEFAGEHAGEHTANTGVESESDGEEPRDASASHNVDPLPPSGFRLKDIFGGGRRKEEERVVEAPAPAKTVASVSAYSPGAGLVEEEIIEEEEYEFTPLKAHHGDEHDLEELEEETLQQQIRSGALGEMLQEAHLDHRIQLESVDDDESDPDDEAEEISAPGAGRTAAPSGGRERSDRSGERGGRGRRGRSGAGSGNGDSRRGAQGMSRRTAQTSDLPIISDLLKPGQEILVQIAKEPIAKKGARITSHIALPGRFLVFMPTVSHVGVSRKIASDEERQRLKRILVSEKGDASGGFIVRTAAEGATEEELRADLRFLINLWADIKQRADTSKPPALIYHDLNLIERILRDQVSDNFSHIWVDSEADYERIVRFLNRFSPELVRRVKLYTKEVPLFEHFGIQDEISKALRSKVWLKSGGSIVINQTEALVAIDINTGKFVGKTARLEDTILKTNLDAIPEIVRQIRLRDLGGIIVIDFIDMDERKNRTRVMAALEEALKQDRAPTKVLQFNDFGLVAITRKRVKQSLERTLSVPCPVCQATGMVKSPTTVANEIYIEMRKMRKHFDQSEVLVRVNPETAKALKSNNAKWLTELEDLTGKNVLIKSDATLHPEQFDIQG
jgi:Rne/Rng family ribonuclease